MRIVIKKSKAKGVITAPPSKSMAHRALICAALSGGGEVSGVDFSRDILATLSCLEALGAKTQIIGSSVRLSSLDVFHPQMGAELNCSESGSTLRFMIPLCLLSGERIMLCGAERLFERPLGIYEEICRRQGIEFNKEGSRLILCGRLKPGNYEIPGDVSSQFITGLLFALPMLGGNSVIKVTGKFESASYIDLTLKSLKDFGVVINRIADNIFEIPGSQKYAPKGVAVEGDYSNAAFLDAFNLLGGRVMVEGLEEGSLQGDRAYKRFFEELKEGKKNFDLSDCPDLAPVMFAVSAAFRGAFFEGTRRLKIKESDRAAAMAAELLKFGVQTEIGENSVKIIADSLHAPKDALCGHNDHRIVMALSLLCSLFGGEIEGAEAVAKSYPDFWECISSLGVELYEA